jgi:DNA primase
VAILIGAGISVQVALLPKGTDPDTFLLQFGKSGMEKLIGSAVHFIDFYIDQMRGKGKLVTISDRAETARSILSVVSKIKDPIERNLMIKETGEKLGLDEKMLMNQLTLKPVESFSASSSEAKNLSARVGAEEDLLHLLVENSPQWAKPIFHFVNPSHFKKKEIQIVVSAIFYAFSQGNELNSNTILDLYRDSPEMIQFLTGLLSQDFEKQANLSQLALDCIVRLRQEEIQERIDIIKNEVKTLQHEGKDNIKLAQECLNIRKSFDKLKVEITEEWKKHVENV